jgi:hypothetical protein
VTVHTPKIATAPALDRQAPVANDVALVRQLTPPASLSAQNIVPRLGSSITRAIAGGRYQLMRLGPAAVVGVAATLTAVVIALTVIMSIRNATHDLELRIANARQHPPAARPEDAAGKLVSSLPSREQIPAVLGQVLQQAGLAGVTLATGHYAYSPPKAGEVARYELDFPLKAEYPAVRDFIDRTLTAVPAAGLDKLDIERKAVGDTLVNADVRFVVFVRSEPQK